MSKGNKETKKYDVYLVISPSPLGFLQAAAQGPHLVLELGQLSDLTVAILGCCPILLKEPTPPLLEFLHSSLSLSSLLGLLGKLLLQILANS